MGHGLRWFIAEDDGTVTRVPAATCEHWFDGEGLPAARAGRDLRLLEVVVDVDRHHVVGVLRLLPFRQGVREDGRLDVSAATRLAMKRVDLLGPVDPGDAAAQIERLEADANYFWWPTDGQLRALGTALLKRPPMSFLRICYQHHLNRPDSAGAVLVIPFRNRRRARGAWGAPGAPT